MIDDRMSRKLLIAAGITLAALAPGAVADELPRKHRLIVLTDIGGDPDDQQSFVRLLLYANEFDLEGLLATSTRETVNPHLIHERLDAYERVRPNLIRHAEGYPAAEELRQLVFAGSKTRMMSSVGAGRSTPASQRIIEVVDRDDPRPVWITVWGAATDLAQALWDVRETRGEEDVRRFVEKLRVYDIAGQDDSGAWICHTFPNLFYLRSVLQFQAISVRISRPFPEHVTGANIDTFTTEWVEEHVRSQGPLGSLYPERKYKYEGDTPAFLYLLPNGLSDPEHPEQGNWGGRFNPVRTVNAGAFMPRYAESQIPHRPFAMLTEAADTWHWKQHVYQDSPHAALFRWREEFQNDFAARMDWSITDRFDAANHNPVAALAGDTSGDVVHLTVNSGEMVALSAEGSSDPDGDALAYHWWHYPEPGTFGGTVEITNPRAMEASFTAPEVWAPRTIQIVLTVHDDGEPNLYSYRRVIVTVNHR